MNRRTNQRMNKQQIKEQNNKQIEWMNNWHFPIQVLVFHLYFSMRTPTQGRHKKPRSDALSADVTTFKRYLNSYVVILCFIFEL